jgi:hypothetical protein
MGREEGERREKIRVIVLLCILAVQLLVTSNQMPKLSKGVN